MNSDDRVSTITRYQKKAMYCIAVLTLDSLRFIAFHRLYFPCVAHAGRSAGMKTLHSSLSATCQTYMMTLAWTESIAWWGCANKALWRSRSLTNTVRHQKLYVSSCTAADKCKHACNAFQQDPPMLLQVKLRPQQTPKYIFFTWKGYLINELTFSTFLQLWNIQNFEVLALSCF